MFCCSGEGVKMEPVVYRAVVICLLFMGRIPHHMTLLNVGIASLGMVRSVETAPIQGQPQSVMDEDTFQ